MLTRGATQPSLLTPPQTCGRWECAASYCALLLGQARCYVDQSYAAGSGGDCKFSLQVFGDTFWNATQAAFHVAHG
jgi:hypothetical protein